MPSHFDRFRLLNGGSRLLNEGEKVLYVRPEDALPPVEVYPADEIDLPFSGTGEVIIEVPREDP